MDAHEKRISLKIDVRSGTIELDAPADSFEHAIEKTKELTSSLDLRRREDGSLGHSETASEDDAKRASQVRTSAPAQERTRSKSGRSASGARSGRLGSFTPEIDLLNEEQQLAIRDFRTSKAPSDHHDEVLAALYQGEKLLARQGFNYNQIYTLMWRAGAPLPKALDEVLRMLVQQQLVERNDAGYFLKFMGRERVERELPRKKE